VSWLSFFAVVRSGVLHGGDSDSTGCMAGAWFGTLYGFKSELQPVFRLTVCLRVLLAIHKLVLVAFCAFCRVLSCVLLAMMASESPMDTEYLF
jgi:hypothetical protein